MASRSRRSTAPTTTMAATAANTADPAILSGLAPAKLNLALHVIGRRPDGYHLIDTLVAFADFGDRIAVAPSERLSLSVTGPQAHETPTDEHNLVLKAARALADAVGLADVGAHIALDKHLPSASGIGGGSSDAATALRLLASLWGVDADLAEIAQGLGADVPMCLQGRPLRAEGIGERLSSIPALPDVHIVLANPGRSVETAAVFKTCRTTDNARLPTPYWDGLDAFVHYLQSTRNDLADAATALDPGIGPLLATLRGEEACLYANMSGSGATCFGLFAAAAEADDCALRLQESGVALWVVSGALATA